MQKNIMIIVSIMLLFSCTVFSEETQIADDDRYILELLIGAWISLPPDRIANPKSTYDYSWGTDLFYANFTKIFDYHEDNKKLLIIFGNALPAYKVTKIERIENMQYALHLDALDHQLDIEVPEENRIAYVTFIAQDQMLLDLTQQWLLGPYSKKNWYRISSPSSKSYFKVY